MTRAPRAELIRLREGAGKTRAQLAREINVSGPYVYRVEIGERDPSVRIIAKWMKALPYATADMFLSQQDAA